MATYNGHKNWNHWNVSLWIGNDESLYNLAQDCIRNNHSNRAKAVDDFIALIETDKTPDGAPYSKSAVRAAMVGM